MQGRLPKGGRAGATCGGCRRPKKKEQQQRRSNNKRMKICLRRAPSDFSPATASLEGTPFLPAPSAVHATALHVGCHFLHKRTQFSMLRAARGGAGAETGQGRQCVERGKDLGWETGGGREGSCLR